MISILHWVNGSFIIKIDQFASNCCYFRYYQFQVQVKLLHIDYYAPAVGGSIKRYRDPSILHTHTHTRLTPLFPGLPGWAGTRKVKPIWILLKQETVIHWTVFCLITDVLLLIVVLGVFLDIFKLGALLAPLGKIFYRLNSKWPTPPLGKSLNYDI